MGDPTTHAVFFSAYWHLAMKEGGNWINTDNFETICEIGAEDKAVELERTDG